MPEVTRLLEAAHRGDTQAAADLLPVVYAELRQLAAARMAQEKPGLTLDATALVHEAYLRLVARPGAEGPEARFDGRGHFFAAAAEAMRRILVDQARRRRAARHGGHVRRETLEPDQIAAPVLKDDVIALNDALDLLTAKDPHKAALVKLRYFAGLTTDQAAVVLGISPSAADRAWSYARAWLKRAMTDVAP